VGRGNNPKGAVMMLPDPGARMTPWLEAAWLQRYLERRLDAEETAWFEAYLMDKPELVDRLEADSDLRDGLAEASRGAAAATGRGVPAAQAVAAGVEAAVDTGTVAAGSVASSDGSTRRQISHRSAHDVPPRRRGLANTLALAASLIFGVGMGWIWQRSTAQPELPALMASPTRIIYDAERDERTPPRIEHADSKSPYVLIEIAVPPGAEHVRIKMENAAEQELVPSPEGFVSFLMKTGAGDIGFIEYTIGSESRRLTLRNITGRKWQ
jgi:hypothetical protein